MVVDNTPTVTSRRRKPTPHQRLRLEKAKELKKMGALTKKKRAAKKQKLGETDPEKMVAIDPPLPKGKKNTLATPGKPPAKFRKRQIHKSWLPTHLWHAKRARMTEPKYPLWRFAIPLTPTEKCYRTTHRAATSRGCVAWDTSYVGTIGIEGVEASLLGLLRGVGVAEGMLSGKREAKWRSGTRSWEGWVRERDGDQNWMAPVKIVWCAAEETSPGEETAQEKKKSKRKMLLRVHPSAFLGVWNEVLKVAKVQRPQAMVEDLRFEIGSIEVIGPASTEALISALHPVLQALPSKNSEKEKIRPTTDVPTKEPQDEEWEDILLPHTLWPQVASLTNPSSLPINALLAFNITDPRLHQSLRTFSKPKTDPSNDQLLSLLSSWPPDQTQTSADIFDRTKRLTAARLLSSQKAINRRKSSAAPGTNPPPSSKDPQIPILLLASRAPSVAAGQGSWTLLLPWDCVLPVWYSLVHHPVSTGGTPRFGGLQEKRQIAFEQGGLWFPGDFPGTKAGWELEMRERVRAREEWERRPKGKRVEYGSLILGERKGEVGMGWGCDWERLFLGPPVATHATEKDMSGHKTKPTSKPTKTTEPGKKQENGKEAARPPEPAQPLPPPPLNIHHLPSSLKHPLPLPPTALTPIHLIPLTTGHPARCARIYRLPTDPELKSQWLELATPAQKNNDHQPSRSKPTASTNSGTRKATEQAPHIRAANLATSLLHPPDPTKKKNLAATTPVPGEDDLIGFVTSSNYHLGEGRCAAVGNIAVAKVLHAPDDAMDSGIEPFNTRAKNRTASKERKTGSTGGGFCIVRDAGQVTCRLARWRFAP